MQEQTGSVLYVCVSCSVSSIKFDYEHFINKYKINILKLNILYKKIVN